MSVRSGAPGLDQVRRSTPGVTILRWPAQAERRAEVVAVGRPMLWVLDQGELPPELGLLEDWARSTDGERDVHARLERLAALGPGQVALLSGDVRVEDGLLCFGGHRVTIPPTDAVLLDRLAETPEQVVTREELTDLLWDGRPAGRSSLAARVHTLRKRLRPVGLEIHVIRGRGFLLAAAPIPLNAPTMVQEPPRRTPWSNSSPQS